MANAGHWKPPLGPLPLPLIGGAQVTCLNPSCKADWESKLLSSTLGRVQINCYTILEKRSRVSSHNHLLILKWLMSFSKNIKLVSQYSVCLICVQGLFWAVPCLC